MANVVLIETSGNQRYIFATNKRRENVGASQLVHETGVDWVRDAIRQTPVRRVLTITSGKALFLVDDAATGRAVVETITRRALREAPGLHVCGTVSADVDLTEASLHEASIDVHRRLPEVRSSRPGPEMRFLRLPLTDECASSGLPAGGRWQDAGAEAEARSEVSLAKLRSAGRGFTRLGGLLGLGADATRASVDFLEDDADWVAVIHADGNSVGALFRDLDQRIPRTDGETVADHNDRYSTILARFSEAVETCTKEAVAAARADYERRSNRTDALGLLPLVVGGDDVTMVCDGPYGIQLARDFLVAFERATAVHPDVVAVAPDGLGACAGVAIVKPHFPFSLAYDLAEDLTASAKQIKLHFPNRPCSALDFHVLYDASASGLRPIRKRLEVDRGSSMLTALPAVVTNAERLGAGATVEDGAWAERHHWSRIVERVNVLTPTRAADGRIMSPAPLPASQAHDLRRALFSGRAFADSRFQRLLDRYRAEVRPLAGQPGDDSLFWPEERPDKRGVRWVTGVLDALECQELLR